MLATFPTLAISDHSMRLLTAIVNLLVCCACIVYLYLASRDVRWSRSRRRFIIKHPEPAVFWTKMIFAGVATLISLAIGVLILVPHKQTSDFITLPSIDLVTGKGTHLKTN